MSTTRTFRRLFLILLLGLCTLVEGQVFNTHPRNTTVIYGSVASFQCSYIPSVGGVISAPPSWIVTPPSGFATQTLSAMGQRQGLYFYALGTTTSAVLQVQVQRDIPGLNETCFVCSFSTFGATPSGRGCLNIARAPLRPNARIDAIDSFAIRIGWSKPWSALEIKNYTIEVLTEDDVQLRTAVSKGSEAGEFTVNGLPVGVTYRFRVRANSDAGYGDYSDAVSATTRESSSGAAQLELIGIIVGIIGAVIVVAGVVIGSIACCCCYCD